MANRRQHVGLRFLDRELTLCCCFVAILACSIATAPLMCWLRASVVASAGDAVSRPVEMLTPELAINATGVLTASRADSCGWAALLVSQHSAAGKNWFVLRSVLPHHSTLGPGDSSLLRLGIRLQI